METNNKKEKIAVIYCKTYDPGYFESRKAISDERKEELNDVNQYIRQGNNHYQSGRNQETGRDDECGTGRTDSSAYIRNRREKTCRRTGQIVGVPLKTFFGNVENSTLSEMLSSFSCAKDRDIENLVLDEETMLGGSSTPVIYGYFSVLLKVLTVGNYVSNRKRLELDGFSAKIHGKRIDSFPCYLIGQLAKNSDVSSNPVSGKELLEMAQYAINTSVEAVGGRYVMIECHENEKLLEFYRNNSSVIPGSNLYLHSILFLRRN